MYSACHLFQSTCLQRSRYLALFLKSRSTIWFGSSVGNKMSFPNIVTLGVKTANCKQWRGGSEAAGEAALLMAPQSYFFCLLVWDACHVVGTTCNDRRSLRISFEWMRLLQPPNSSMVESWWRSRGPRPLEAPKNLHLTVLNSGSNIAQQKMDGYAFLCGLKCSHRKIPKVQSFQFSSFLSENVHVL